jgi:hypothetical protein
MEIDDSFILILCKKPEQQVIPQLQNIIKILLIIMLIINKSQILAQHWFKVQTTSGNK